MFQHRHLTLSVTVLSIVLSICAGILWGDKASAKGAKPHFRASSDLMEKATGPQGGERVSIIVQPSGAWTSSLEEVVKNYGGSEPHSFRNFKARVISLPA